MRAAERAGRRPARTPMRNPEGADGQVRRAVEARLKSSVKVFDIDPESVRTAITMATPRTMPTTVRAVR